MLGYYREQATADVLADLDAARAQLVGAEALYDADAAVYGSDPALREPSLAFLRHVLAEEMRAAQDELARRAGLPVPEQ